VAITNDQIEFYAGDRRVLGWTLTLAAGGALNLTGKTVRWALVKGTAENYKTLTTQILIGRNATVTVPAGATSATFGATGLSVLSPAVVKVFASVGGAVPNADVQSLQHRGFWPYGRGNHYLFDLNRDWAWLTQAETRARIAR